jgi:hypothetical protein
LMLCGCDVEPEGGVWLMDDPTLRWTLMNWLGPEGFLRSVFVCLCFAWLYYMLALLYSCLNPYSSSLVSYFSSNTDCLFDIIFRIDQ